MTTADVDSTLPATEKRCTPHFFEPAENYILVSGASLGPTRISYTRKSPPAILFDAIYASAVLHTFGTQKLNDTVESTWENVFHPGGVKTSAQVAHSKLFNDQDANEEKGEQQIQDRTARLAGRNLASGPDALDKLMVLPYIMVAPEKLRTMLKDNEEKAEAVEQQRVNEKVDMWMKQVDSD